MEHSMDPYEQQLLSVFNSYDASHCGSLDQEGLLQLCNSLQLEEQGIELIKCLLSDSKSRVTFNEFKDGLLALLGNVQNSRQKLDFNAASDNENDSPDQEISPKFVYGSKRYGRRSRPESTEEIELFDNCNTDLEHNSEVIMEKIENKSLKNLNKVQRSNSQSDVTQSRKRKTSGKLKRCTSFPGNHEMERQFKNWNQEVQLNDQKISSPNPEFTISMLHSVLDHLGIGSDGYLTQLEIVRVCEYMGLHKLAKNILVQLTSKPEPDISEKRSIEEFLEVIQKDNFVYDVLSSTHTLNNSLGSNCVTEDSVLFPNNKTVQYITMGPNGSGVVSSQTIVELWENAGIASAASLLQELGFTNSTIRIIDLVTNLDEELRNLNDSRADISFTDVNPHIVLLQASIVLYQSEVKYLKSVLEQVSAERNKLKIDIADANQRASLLAQEVDDNHAKLEKSTQNQVRLLEQRHSDVLKEVTNQFVLEKEHMSILNSKLEQKIIILENEESRLRSDLLAVQKFNNSLEKENHSLSNQLTELEQIRSSLCDKITVLENECQRFSEIERERDQLEPLFKKLSLLQIENAELRDKNDELCTEVETLNSQIMRTKLPSTPTSNTNIISNEAGLGEENVSTIYEGVVGLGAIKRRVDSPSKNNESNMEIESPRLGKVRRCYNKAQPEEVLLDALGTHVPFNSSESGFEAELDCLDSSLSYTGSDGYTTDEVSHLQARISYLEQLLLQNSIKIPNKLDDSVNNQTKIQLVKRCKELESILEEIKSLTSKMSSMKPETAEKCELTTLILHLKNTLNEIVPETSSNESLAAKSIDNKLVKIDSSTETNTSFIDMEKQLNDKIKENKELKERCEDLDQALEMMRSEFDHCENYWSNKLDEERQIFDQEQKQSSDKLTELLIKISEYEEQFTTHDSMDGRLSPIEEKGCLEQQFAELEDEFNEYRKKMENEVSSKDKEIAALQKKLNSPQINKTTADISTQVDLTENNKINLFESKVSNLTNVVESTNIFSSETLPNMWQYSVNSDSIDSSEIMERENINSTFVWNNPVIEQIQDTSPSSNNTENNIKFENETCSLPPNISWQTTTSVPSPQPHSLNFIPDGSSLRNNSFCRPKRTRKHDRSIFTSQLRLQKKEQDFLHKQTEPESCVNGQCRKNMEMHNGGNQTCIVPLRSIHHLHGRLRELDQHCRHLQFILKQQQRHSESVMHHCWQQHRDEVNEFQMQMKALQDKLARSDMLIKDLYVENTYLMANNQRLEHRCHMLVQCSSESTSV